jgi:hypothetical protein
MFKAIGVRLILTLILRLVRLDTSKNKDRQAREGREVCKRLVSLAAGQATVGTPLAVIARGVVVKG